MPKIYATIGLPGSGKTTHAIEHIKQHGGVRANRDDIRFELFGKYWGKGVNENAVTVEQDAIVADALANGHDVWIDDTNLSPRAKDHIARLAYEHDVDVEWVDLTDVPITACIANDLRRDRSVGEDVIRSMLDRYLKPKPLSNDDDLPECIVIDLDGTLALMGDRSPYDWKRVGVDLPNRMVVEYAQNVTRSGRELIILSGRDGSCRSETIEWLRKNNIFYTELLMRKAGDQRKDWIIKNELLDDLLTRWFPVLAIDDRQQVVDNVWRARGIECWQVAPGRF